MSAGESTNVRAGTPAGARAELVQACGWGLLGLLILIGSLRMDRLESQHINPYTIPGLLPALLGVVMLLLATLLGWRAVAHGALLPEARLHEPYDAAVVRRIAIVIGLCVAFGAGLVGHGLPFWLAGAIFVSVAILVFEHPQRVAAGRALTLRDVAFAATVGIGAGGSIWLVFEYLFLVRLP